MPKCTINGTELEVKDGTTIIQAMTENSQRIAHYCWHPGLSIAGVCRLCMVEIQGMPRVQIACNTVITEGMVINNTSDKVKDAVKWGLDFHLINHPLDCPICDQAGECGLQDQYMEYGKYDPEMAERKVKKRKVVDLGPRVVLDSERCILCSRCVRFTEEVTKTNELGIFNRGDRSEIGTFEDKPLANNYSLNTVDICPVGALTSKDFRFRQRVWYLKEAETVCNGCSTGCNVKTYFNKEGLFRVKPVHNEQVNGWWMCDEGRDTYKFVNKENRLLKAKKRSAQGWDEMTPGAAAKDAAKLLKETADKNGGDSIAVVLTGQHTVEEYESIIGCFLEKFGTKKIYHWVNNKDSFDKFDGILNRGDKNPNTTGLLQVMKKVGLNGTWDQLEADIRSGKIKGLVVAGPENVAVYPCFAEKVKLFSQVPFTVWLTAAANSHLDSVTGNVVQIPLKTYVEKDGTFVNHAGLAQKFKKVTTIVSEALTLDEAAALLTGGEVAVKTAPAPFVEANRPLDKVMMEHRKKNEFVFKRGSL
ncbi:MAG: 2Fe-2S iron-sulfur cluster-binding protein [Pseudobdellovibrionaceae bacterium]